MNREEAIEQFKYAIGIIKQDGKDYLDERDIPMLEMGIEALENQKTGHWIDDEFGTRCSCCNIHTHLDKFGRPMRLLHCSFCGAKMEGE